MALQDRVRELIEHGYDDDVIIMTLGLSNSQLDFIKEQIKKTEAVPKIKTTQKSKLQLLRERYFAIYNSKSPFITDEPKELSPQKIAEITRRLDKIEEIMPDVIENQKGKEGRKYTDVRSLYSYMDNIELPADLAKRAYDLLPTEDQVRKIRDKAATELFKRLINRYRSKYMISIGNEVDSIEDTAKLDEMLAEVRKFSSSSYFAYSTVQSKIIRRKQNINLEKIKMMNAIPENIIGEIADKVLDPNSDLSEVQKGIEEAAKSYYERRMKMLEDSSGKSKVVKLNRPTMEISLKQVRHQMVEAINKANPDIQDASSLLERLVGVQVDKSVAFHTILQNLLNNEKYDEAETFAKASFPNREDWSQIKARKSAMTDIRKSRISTFIMRGINARPTSVEEENKYYQMIQNGIDKSYLEPQNIPLGKTRDGRRTITWADVMEKPKVPKR